MYKAKWLSAMILVNSVAMMAGASPAIHEVKPKPGTVKKDFLVEDNKFDESSAPEAVTAESIDIVKTLKENGKIKNLILLVTKTFKPPAGYEFDDFKSDDTPADKRKYNPGKYFDVQIDPNCLPPTVKHDPTVKKLADDKDSIKVSFDQMMIPSNAGIFPIKIEGNLKPPSGEGGTQPHWSAKIVQEKTYYIEVAEKPPRLLAYDLLSFKRIHLCA